MRMLLVCAAEVVPDTATTPAEARVRRARYSGTHPRRFEHKYKELRGDPAVVAHVEAKGSTAAGTHRPIAVDAVLEALQPTPGDVVADCTLGWGGHAQRLLERIQPGGLLVGLDADGVQLTKTEARLRGLGYGQDTLQCVHSNYAALASVVLERSADGAKCVLADLGVSSMQLDDPARGMTYKHDGVLDMRLDTSRGKPAYERLAAWDAAQLSELLTANADEPHADRVAAAIVAEHRRSPIDTTSKLAAVVRHALPRSMASDDVSASLRRVFQAIRVAVNDEFSKLDALLLALPMALRPGGRVAILTFHSGEDRRVKLAFREGVREGVYSCASDMIRPSWEEQRANPRACSAKLRWAQRA